jgi:hypothetical protein
MGEKEHAQRCCTAINAYWAALGHTAAARLVPGKTERGLELATVWEIETATVNGLPIGCDSRRVPLYGAQKKRAQQ